MFRFPLSLCMVEDMLAARGIIVTHQTIRSWAEKFGRHFARKIKRRSAGRLGNKWHLDECVVASQWHEAIALARRRSGRFRPRRVGAKPQRRQGCKASDAQVVEGSKACATGQITDKLRSYDAARGDVMPGVEHRSHKGLNNRAENSRQPTRRRERMMKRFKSARQLSAFRLHP
jgi:putative transposase